jgi:hypothetical protein
MCLLRQCESFSNFLGLGYAVDSGAVDAFSSLRGAISANISNFPLLRAKRKTQKIANVKADMNSGRTYDLNNANDTPPAMATVVTKSRHAATSVAKIESRTVLWSSAKITSRMNAALKNVVGEGALTVTHE